MQEPKATVKDYLLIGLVVLLLALTAFQGLEINELKKSQRPGIPPQNTQVPNQAPAPQSPQGNAMVGGC